MDFEYDERKSNSNKEKHGIDFVEAQALWRDARAIEIDLPGEDESRILVIGKLGKNHWSAIVTRREDRVRLISVRRSRRKEKERYESKRD